jgi:hypothetical protein
MLRDYERLDNSVAQRAINSTSPRGKSPLAVQDDKRVVSGMPIMDIHA